MDGQVDTCVGFQEEPCHLHASPLGCQTEDRYMQYMLIIVDWLQSVDAGTISLLIRYFPAEPLHHSR